MEKNPIKYLKEEVNIEWKYKIIKVISVQDYEDGRLGEFDTKRHMEGRNWQEKTPGHIEKIVWIDCGTRVEAKEYTDTSLLRHMVANVPRQTTHRSKIVYEELKNCLNK